MGLWKLNLCPIPFCQLSILFCKFRKLCNPSRKPPAAYALRWSESGHTDDKPIRNSRNFADNWELSQARALSVVRYMIDDLGMDPERLSANGFGEYQPIAAGDSEEARALNRRIELKFTEK